MPSLMDLLKFSANRKVDENGNFLPEERDLSQEILSPVEASSIEPSLSPMQSPVQFKQNQLSEEQSIPQESEIPKAPSKSRDFASEQMDAINKLKQKDAIDKLSAEQPKVDSPSIGENEPIKFDQSNIESLASGNKLKELQDAARQERQSAAWQKLGQGLLKASLPMADANIFKQNEAMIDELNQQEASKLKDYQAQVDFQKQDPNSAYSKGARAFLEENFKIKLPPGISASELNNTFLAPALKKYEGEQNREAKQQQLLESIESKKALKELELEAKKEQSRQNDFWKSLAIQQRQSEEGRRGDQYKQSQTERYQAKADTAVKDLRDQLRSSEDLINMTELAKVNPIAQSSIGVMAAKARGEKGALSATDVTRYVENKAYANKVSQWINNAAQGTITKENAEFLKEVERAIQGRLKDRINQSYERIADLYSKNVKVDKNEARDLLIPDDVRNVNMKSDDDIKALNWAKEKIKSGTPDEKQDAKIILQSNGIL